MGAPYSSIAVANNFIDLACQSCDNSLTPMKLQKLVFYSHGWYLALSGQPLIIEKVEAWKYGPVIPAVYHKFKDYGNDQVSKPAEVYEIKDGKLTIEIPKVDDDQGTIALIKRIWESYGKYTGVQLSNATHSPGTPWHTVWEVDGGKLAQGVPIPNQLIADFFKKQMAKP
jgi:uncharacterized phage-associated protein